MKYNDYFTEAYRQDCNMRKSFNDVKCAWLTAWVLIQNFLVYFLLYITCILVTLYNFIEILIVLFINKII